MAKKQTTPARPGKTVEIAGVLLIILAALIFLSLLSHVMRDASFNSKPIPSIEPQNIIGRFGSYTSDLLIQFGGFASVLLPLILAIIGLLLYRKHSFKMAFGQIVGYLLLLVSLATILALFFEARGGGAVGLALATQLHFMLGTVGGAIVAFALLVVALILGVNFSFVTTFGWINKTAKSIAGSLREWWTVRRTARERMEKHDQVERATTTKTGPIIRGGGEAPLEPMARESKTSLRKTDPPVRSTRLDREDTAVPPPPPKRPEPMPKPKRKEAEQITIHSKGETVSAQQISFTKLAGQYEPPPLRLLQNEPEVDKDLDREALIAQSVALESKLATFGVTGKVVEIHPGPVITMFEYEPDPGIKVSKIANLEDDLAMALQAEKIRIIAPIPGKGAVGIEVPSLRREIVYLREILESKEFNEAVHPLTVAFGKDSTGRPMVQNLAKMPHLLVAGTTGSGKSVFLNCIIMSLIHKSTPEDVRLLMVDPKQLELSMYTDTPHMLHPVIIEPKKAALLLRWAVTEMEDRYRKLAEQRVRTIDGYNAKVAKLQRKPRKGKLTGDEEPLPEKLPYIVLIIDELADLMMIAAKEVEESIARLAQMARAAGIHLILATQRPSVDVITGIIKANFPSRIAFQVRSRIDSRTILDESGANNLLGMGDGLFLPPGAACIERFHAPFVADEEVHGIVRYLKENHAPPPYVEIRTSSGTDLNDASVEDLQLVDDGADDLENQLFDQAVAIVARDRKASVSYIQRKLKIGYNRAARIVERMEEEGMISRSDGTSRARDIYLPERDYD
ncbi:MAG: DNA translocase FtsK 4TM domain-containing protein [Candidatus Lernaella stagnicola]|nr:DNA translocase FtsK 4TM domain-containing protein [Candidatus Lernaella stagnicola]